MGNHYTIINVQSVQPTYTALGMGPLQPDTTAASATEAIQKQLTTLVTSSSSWPAEFPSYEADQLDQGIMGPWNQNVAGQAPPCLVQQITMDFSNWELPSDSTAITSMASQITEEISSNGGLSGKFYGRTRVGGSETIYWAVGFGTGAIAETPEEMGIIYVFTAVLGLN